MVGASALLYCLLSPLLRYVGHRSQQHPGGAQRKHQSGPLASSAFLGPGQWWKTARPAGSGEWRHHSGYHVTAPGTAESTYQAMGLNIVGREPCPVQYLGWNKRRLVGPGLAFRTGISLPWYMSPQKAGVTKAKGYRHRDTPPTPPPLALTGGP